MTNESDHGTDPSPETIAAICKEIRRGWSSYERMTRLRSDWRPQFAYADGQRVDLELHQMAQHADDQERRALCQA